MKDWLGQYSLAASSRAADETGSSGGSVSLDCSIYASQRITRPESEKIRNAERLSFARCARRITASFDHCKRTLNLIKSLILVNAEWA
jgi:hypothetical protein